MFGQKGKLWAGVLILLFMLVSCQLPGEQASSDSASVPTTDPALRRLPTPESVQENPLTTNANGEQIYTHPSGTFSLPIPEGWNIETDEYGSVYAEEPGEEGAIYVTVTNTGHALSVEDFARFVEAREENFFRYFDDYLPGTVQLNQEKDEALVRKTVQFNEIPDTVDTYYFRQDQAVFVIDTWMETSLSTDYEVMYQDILGQFSYTSTGVADFYEYNYVWVFYDTLDTFSFEVPISWAYRYKEDSDGIVDQFWAPDEKALIEHIMLLENGEETDEGKQQLVLDQLTTTLPDFTKGVTINTSYPMDDGSLQIEWTTEQGWEGISAVLVYENDLLILNGLYQTAFRDSYLSTIEYALDYYSVPAAIEE